VDVIFISELRLDILVGVYDWEARVPQKVQFDLELALPATGAGSSDNLADTIDYAAVVARIEQSLAGCRFGLLEKLAEHVAGLLMQEFRCTWVKVSVAKLVPLRNVRRLGVTIERGRKGVMGDG
jgi:7,8-dihydroneopterin aldolase/epimerase/oxygenase